ncbi:TPR repeat protein [Novosphingobium sp. ST904]|nr:TPR repeat protein [Novosphingobium sp. ST904]
MERRTPSLTMTGTRRRNWGQSNVRKNLRSLRLGLCGCTLAGLAFTPALADVKAGVDAWSAGNYQAAVQQWKPLADKGDADAEFNLAQAYKMGRGVPLDPAKAEDLYGKAAAKGHIQAADTYGLMLFQRGERQKALPYLEASAERGDARAEYILGVAHFNGDVATKDWVRAYALVSLARQAGLPQAANALAQMDEHIPLEDRQKSVQLAAQLSSEAEANRARQTAGAELGSPARAAPTPTLPKVAAVNGPANAGADYTLAPSPRPAATSMPSRIAAAPPVPKAEPVKAQPPKPPAPKAPAPKPQTSPAAAAGSSWRLQLGAFGVSGNAEKLWASISGRPEMAGSRRQLVPAGKLTKLYATGFSSKAQAEKACVALRASGKECIVTS